METFVNGEGIDRVAGVPGLHRLLRHLRAPTRSKDTCPACGATYEHVRSSGLMGCGLCYSVFGDRLKLPDSS